MFHTVCRLIVLTRLADTMSPCPVVAPVSTAMFLPLSYTSLTRYAYYGILLSQCKLLWRRCKTKRTTRCSPGFLQRSRKALPRGWDSLPLGLGRCHGNVPTFTHVFPPSLVLYQSRG